MACSEFCNILIGEKTKIKCATAFSRENDSSMNFFDDLQMIRMIRKVDRDVKLSNNPNLDYLNLLDFENKKGDFLSSRFQCVAAESVLGKFNSLEETFEYLEKFTSASIFCFYVNYLKNIPKDFIDLQTFERRIFHAVRNLKQCNEFVLSLIINEIINLYYVSPKGKILFLIVLKHVCSTDELITYTAEYFLTNCNARFFKVLLDGCIDIRFNLWTMWQRNVILNNAALCPVTIACFRGRWDFLKVLLQYGFRQMGHKVSTLEILLDEHEMLDDFPWLKEFISKFSQNPRTTVVLEVFLFIEIFLYDSIRPDVLAKCFQLAWDARKEPYVTKQELLNAFEEYIRLRIPGCNRNEVNTLTPWFMQRLDFFRTLLPDYLVVVSQPRSLQHLCRCTVREELYNNMEMPRGIAKLPIPEKMKSYILLK